MMYKSQFPKNWPIWLVLCSRVTFEQPEMSASDLANHESLGRSYLFDWPMTCECLKAVSSTEMKYLESLKSNWLNFLNSCSALIMTIHHIIIQKTVCLHNFSSKCVNVTILFGGVSSCLFRLWAACQSLTQPIMSVWGRNYLFDWPMTRECLKTVIIFQLVAHALRHFINSLSRYFTENGSSS